MSNSPQVNSPASNSPISVSAHDLSGLPLEPPLRDPHTWLRFDSANCTLSVANILMALDRSGNGNHHQSPAVGSQQPTLVDNVIGGRQGAKFVRANSQYLFCNALHTAVTAGAGIFVVVKELVVGSGTRVDAYLHGQLVLSPGIRVGEDSGLIVVSGSAGATSSLIQSPGSTYNQPITAIVYCNWGTNARAWVNGVQLLSGSTQAGTMASSWIGAFRNVSGAGTPTLFAEMELCEIFVVDYGRDLYEAEIRQQFRYLNNYYRGIY
jgi:hypothetical protein